MLRKSQKSKEDKDKQLFALLLCTNLCTGGHPADSWDLWWGEEEDEHWHGADHRPVRPLPG